MSSDCFRRSRTCPCVRLPVGEQPVLGNREQRLVQKPASSGDLLELERFGHGPICTGVAEHDLRSQLRDEDVPLQSPVAELPREGECRIGMARTLVEPVQRVVQRRCDAFVSGGEYLAVLPGLCNDLEEELRRLFGVLVGADPRQRPQSARSLLARRQRRDERLKLRLRPPRIARLEVQICGLDGPADGVFAAHSRGQLLSAVEEERRGSRRTAPSRVVSCVLDGPRDGLVGLVDRRRELPRSGLGIFE